MPATRDQPAAPVRPGFAPRACLAGLGLLLMLSACRERADQPSAQGEESVQAEVLAQGDGWTIRAGDFRHWWASHPGAGDSPQARGKALDAMIERAVLAQAARQAGLDRDPETAGRIESLLIARLQELELNPLLEAVEIPDDEVRAHYDALRDSTYTKPETVRVALLWFNTRGQPPLVARYRPRLEQIRADVSAGGDEFPVAAGFGPIAVGNTEHRPSRLRGGDLGWIEVNPGIDSWRQEVLDLAAPLKNPGDLSAIVAGQEGLFLVRLIERRASAVRPFETVRAGILEGLVAERRKRLQEEFARRILSQAQAERFPAALAALGDLSSRDGTENAVARPPAPSAKTSEAAVPTPSKPNRP